MPCVHSVHSSNDRRSMLHTQAVSTRCDGVKWSVWPGMVDYKHLALSILGMAIPPLIGNPYNGYINPYYWVEFPIPYGNIGSWDWPQDPESFQDPGSGMLSEKNPMGHRKRCCPWRPPPSANISSRWIGILVCLQVDEYHGLREWPVCSPPCFPTVGVYPLDSKEHQFPVMVLPWRVSWPNFHHGRLKVALNFFKIASFSFHQESASRSFSSRDTLLTHPTLTTVDGWNPAPVYR